MGFYYSSGLSKSKIEPFIENFDIAMADYEPVKYESFNNFFIRKFRPGVRNFEAEGLAGPCEARYFGYSQTVSEFKFPVKSKYLTEAGLLGSVERAEPFVGGPLVIARLCPVDYHRYHYPIDGRTIEKYRVKGGYQSVNPVALRVFPDIFEKNIREVSILDTEFGKIAFVEVGAAGVGKIVQSNFSSEFKRGDEKGYFLFGASTVVLLGEKGKWKVEKIIEKNSEQGLETYIRLGEKIGERPN